MATVIVTALAVSIDGFLGGFAFGLRRVYITVPRLLFVSIITALICTPAVAAGLALGGYIPEAASRGAGAALLMVLAVLALREAVKKRVRKKSASDTEPGLPERSITLGEGAILGVAVAADASAAAFVLALSGQGGYAMPFIIGLTHFILIGLGNRLSIRGIPLRLSSRLSLLPAALFMLLAFLRFV